MTTNRDLDAAIARDIYGWRYLPVGKDYDGENEGQILFWPDREMDHDYIKLLPTRGQVHEGFWCPSYSNDLTHAVTLAQYIGLPVPLRELSTEPATLARQCYDYWQQQQAKSLDGSVLELVLKAKWYYLILSGTKKQEYRDIKLYWWRRIFTSPMPLAAHLMDGGYNGRHRYVRFRLGYRPDAPTMIWRLGHVGVGNALPTWAEGNMNRMIVLNLHKRVR